MDITTIKKIFISIGSFCIILSFQSCIHKDNELSDDNYETEITTDYSESKNPSKPPAPENIGEQLPITRGLTAKMIALTFGTKADIDSTERTIPFSDTSADKWYDKYINYCCSKDYFKKDENNFLPEEYLTVAQAQEIIDKIDTKRKIKINMTDETKNKAISYNLWTEIYIEVLKNLSEKNSIKDTFGISAEKSVILALPENNKYMKQGFAVTDKGLLRCAGFDLSPYIDKEISFWTKENELFALGDITNKNPIIKNVFIIENNNTCKVFTGGAEKTYDKAENFNQKGNEIKIADITHSDKKLTEINYADEIKEKQIQSIDEKKLVCVDNETFDILPDCKVYYTKDNKTMLGSKEDLLEGKTYEICLRDNKICAFIFSKI